MESALSAITERPATIKCENDTHAGLLYYVTVAGRTPGPYKTQRRVEAILDIASDGTLAGIELIDNMPPMAD